MTGGATAPVGRSGHRQRRSGGPRTSAVRTAALIDAVRSPRTAHQSVLADDRACVSCRGAGFYDDARRARRWQGDPRGTAAVLCSYAGVSSPVLLQVPTSMHCRRCPRRRNTRPSGSSAAVDGTAGWLALAAQSLTGRPDPRSAAWRRCQSTSSRPQYGYARSQTKNRRRAGSVV